MSDDPRVRPIMEALADASGRDPDEWRKEARDLLHLLDRMANHLKPETNLLTPPRF